MSRWTLTGLRLLWALAWAVVVTAFPNAVFAEEVMMEEIMVTGTRIKRIDAQSVNPLVTITAQEMTDVGYNSLQEVLGALTQNSGGSLDQQQTFGFTPAASAVNLRGVGIGRTLTLIDGKRAPKYPIGAFGTDNFADTANIPIAAIERVEVLTTGASAVYGSDAMGGVINVITKAFFQGFNVDAKIGDTDNGGFGQTNINVMAGVGDEDRNILFLVDYEKWDRLKANQRMGFNDLGSDLAFGGLGSYSAIGISLLDFGDNIVRTLQDPECTDRGLQRWDPPRDICGFNRSNRRDLMPERDRTSVMAKWNYALSDAVEFYGRLDYTRSNTDIAIEPMPVDEYSFFVGLDENSNADPGFVTGLSDRSGSTARFDQATAFGGDFAALPDGGYYYSRRMIEFGNREQSNKVDNYALLSGFRGEINDWSWDVDWSFMRTDYADTLSGYASADSYFAFLTSGPSGRSSFDVMSVDEVKAAAYTPYTKAQSTINQFSIGFSTPSLFELPSGAVGFAAGFETAKEWFENTSDSESLKGNILATGGSSGRGSRDYNAVYTEFLFPVVESVEIQVALRYDDYNDFGDNLAPMIGVQWRPIDSLMFRASWAQTFRAPDLQRVYGDPTVAFSQVTDPVGCTAAGGVIGDDNFAPCRGETFVDVTVGPNIDLDAEQGENYNIGMVFQMAGFDASLDFWNVEIEDIVNDLSAQAIVNNPDQYESLITRNPVSMEAEAVDAVARNLTFQETRGLDLALGYNLSTDRAGIYDFRIRSTYLLKWDNQFDVTSDTVDLMRDGRVPEWRVQFTTNWTLGHWGSTLWINYIDSMNGLNNDLFDRSDPDIPKLTIASWTTANLSGYWANDNFRLQLGVNNLTNEGPKADETDSWPFYPQEYHNAIGRQYYLQMSYNSGG